MYRPERRHQRLDKLTDQGVAVIAEEGLRPMVDQPDHPRRSKPTRASGMASSRARKPTAPDNGVADAGSPTVEDIHTPSTPAENR